jgi:hypothetical protein
VPALITQAELERKIGPQNLAQLTSDDGSDVADATIVDEIIEEASDRAIGLLWSGFPAEQRIIDLVTADRAVKGAILDIAAELAGMRRSVLQTAEGKTPYSGWAARGEKRLAEVASGKRRARGEAEVGKNDRLGTRVNQASPPRRTVFASTSDDPVGPGGF